MTSDSGDEEADCGAPSSLRKLINIARGRKTAATQTNVELRDSVSQTDAPADLKLLLDEVANTASRHTSAYTPQNARELVELLGQISDSLYADPNFLSALKPQPVLPQQPLSTSAAKPPTAGRGRGTASKQATSPGGALGWTSTPAAPAPSEPNSAIPPALPGPETTATQPSPLVQASKFGPNPFLPQPMPLPQPVPTQSLQPTPQPQPVPQPQLQQVSQQQPQLQQVSQQQPQQQQVSQQQPQQQQVSQHQPQQQQLPLPQAQAQPLPNPSLVAPCSAPVQQLQPQQTQPAAPYADIRFPMSDVLQAELDNHPPRIPCQQQHPAAQPSRDNAHQQQPLQSSSQSLASSPPAATLHQHAEAVDQSTHQQQLQPLPHDQPPKQQQASVSYVSPRRQDIEAALYDIGRLPPDARLPNFNVEAIFQPLELFTILQAERIKLYHIVAESFFNFKSPKPLTQSTMTKQYVMKYIFSQLLEDGLSREAATEIAQEVYQRIRYFQKQSFKKPANGYQEFLAELAQLFSTDYWRKTIGTIEENFASVVVMATHRYFEKEARS